MARIGPFKGIRNVVAAEQLEANELAAGVNCDVNDNGRLVRRVGTTSLSATAADSLYARGEIAVFRRSDTLRRLYPDGSSIALVSSVTQPVCYCGVGERIYWSDGLITGVVVAGEAQAWGIRPPLTLPNYAAVASGNLPRGRYRYAVTYLRDGQESGTGAAGQTTTDIEGGITLSSIPVPTDATEKAIYLSRPNGAELYRAMIVSAATTSATYSGDTTGLGPLLDTQWKQNPPAGACLAEHNGSILIGVGHHVLFTSPYRHDLVDPVRMSYRFDSCVRLLAPVQGGVYVGTDTEIVWFAGDDIANASPDVKATYGAVPGTLGYVDGAFLGTTQLSGRAALFATKEGICAGGQGGQFVNLSFDRYAYPESEFGAGVVYKQDGRDRFIAALRRL